MLLTPEEIDPDYVGTAQVLHLGSIGVIGEPSRSATLRAVELARKEGVTVAYDPNLWLALWPNPGLARAGLLEGWQSAQVIKAGLEAVFFLAGDSFVAALLSGLARCPAIDSDATAVDRLCRFANGAGALATTRRGAIPALPTAAEVEAFLASRGFTPIGHR